MAFPSLGSSFESILKNRNIYGDAHSPMGDLQDIIKSFHGPDEMDDPEPTSVLELSMCISPPLSHEEWAYHQKQLELEVLNHERLAHQQILHQQQLQMQWQQQQQQQQQQNHQLWEQHQAEISDLHHMQSLDRLNNHAGTGIELPYAYDTHHLLQSTWDTVNCDPYQGSGGNDPMMQTLHSNPWVDFQQQEVFGRQLMQGLPCLEDPLILESWMATCSGDSCITSPSGIDVESSSSQSFLSMDEHESPSNNWVNHQQQQMNTISRSSSECSQQQSLNNINRCSSASSAGSLEVSDLVETRIGEQCDMQLILDNLDSSAAPMEDIKPSPNWYVPGIQDTIGPPVGQQVLASSSTYPQSSQPGLSSPASPVPKFEMTIPGPDSISHLSYRGTTDNFVNAKPVAPPTQMKPSPRLFENPLQVIASGTVASTPPAVEAPTKPSAKLWGPIRPTSHSLGSRDSIYSNRPVSETSAMSRRKADNAINQRSGADYHLQKNGPNDGHRGHNTGGAGRVVTLAELASGGVKMGGVQLPTVGTQIPSNVRLAVETQASGMGGVRMVQVLLACAEAVACRDSRQANILLQQLQHMASPYGDAMQRITACFVEGLSARLASTGSQPFKFTNPVRRPPSDAEKREGFNLVYQLSPYVAFGHFAANSAILEAFEGEERMHIIDLGMTNSLQWPYLIHGLAKRPSGAPKLLRITGFANSVESMKQAGEELARVAAEAKIPFEFQAVEGRLEDLKKTKLELRDGEALAVNTVLQLHCVVKESRGSLNSVLQSIHELSPKILTLVEQDASHNGPFFLGRFMEALHYYSAIFDSLDAILPRNSEQRVKMEQFHFAQEIKNIVSCEGSERVERHERVDQWRRRMSRAGFQPLPLKFLSQARVWLGLYSCDGYTLSEEKGCLVLGWKGKPIIAASSWKR